MVMGLQDIVNLQASKESFRFIVDNVLRGMGFTEFHGQFGAMAIRSDGAPYTGVWPLMAFPGMGTAGTWG